MYKIKILKKEKKEKIPVPPKFRNKQEELAWYRKQKMKTQILQIKHINIQYKDIKQMIFDEDTRLVHFALRTNFNEIDDLNKYTQISRFKDGQDIIVALIINSYWLVNEEELENKSFKEIDQECINIEKEIENLKKLKQTEKIENKIILLNYKLNTIREYLDKNKSLIL